jgi:hypothetical protein
MRPATISFSRGQSTPPLEWAEPVQAEQVFDSALENDKAKEQHTVAGIANISCQHEPQYDPGGCKSTESEGRSLSTSSELLGNLKMVTDSSPFSEPISESPAEQEINLLRNSGMTAAKGEEKQSGGSETKIFPDRASREKSPLNREQGFCNEASGPLFLLSSG